MVLGTDAALRLEDLEFISKDIWLQVSLKWVYRSHFSNCQHTCVPQSDWFVKCGFKFSFSFKFKWHEFTGFFVAPNLVWLTLWRNKKTPGVKVMAGFHQCNLGQNFTLGYKTINHTSHSSKKLLGNPDCPTHDLSTCMAMLLRCDEPPDQSSSAEQEDFTTAP